MKERESGWKVEGLKYGKIDLKNVLYYGGNMWVGGIGGSNIVGM